jgi:Methylamine utilisation protein MauE
MHSRLRARIKIWQPLRKTLLFFQTITVALFALVFAFSAFSHFNNPHAFALNIARYQIMPNWLSVVTAGVLPSLEVAIACSFLFRSFRQASLLASVFFCDFLIRTRKRCFSRD